MEREKKEEPVLCVGVILEEMECRLCCEGKSKASIRKYISDAGQYLEYVCDRYGSEEYAFDRGVLEEYRKHMLAGYRITSVNSKIAGINQLMKSAGHAELKLGTCKVQKRAFRGEELSLSKEDYHKLISEAEAEGNERLSMIIQTLGSTGIRISELPFITVESLTGRCAVVSLKGKTRNVILPEKLCCKLRIYCRKKGINKGSIFITKSGRPVDRSNVLHDLKRLCGKTDVDPHKVFPHNFRHLFAVTYYGMYKDITNLADILGHSNINTTRIYTALSQRELENSIERMGLI